MASEIFDPTGRLQQSDNSKQGIMNGHNEQSAIPIVMLTVRQLQELIREEIQVAITNSSGDRASGDRHSPYLTVKEAADIASLAPSTIRLFIRKGELKGLKVGRRVVIERAELERFLRLNPTGVWKN